MNKKIKSSKWKKGSLLYDPASDSLALVLDSYIEGTGARGMALIATAKQDKLLVQVFPEQSSNLDYEFVKIGTI